MIPPRQREADAIAILVILHLDTDEWLPEHYDTAEEAARVVAPWLRRARVGEDVPVKHKGSGGTVRSRKPAEGPTAATRLAVEQRARGFCEVSANGCGIKGHHLHHRLMRSQGGGHDPANLLLVCWRCHDYIHSHPEYAYERGWLLHAGAV